MLVMAAIAWFAGSAVWKVFVLAVGAVCYGEFARLIVKAFPSATLRFLLLLFGLIYIGLGIFALCNLQGGVVYHGDVPGGGRLIETATLLAVVGLVVCTDVGAYFF